MQAILALEDGRIFRGQGYGHPGECQGEVVFNTSLTGYQEIATDPSYAGQIVVLTNPQIGNYGTNRADNESAKPYIEGLIVREFSPISSNWRSEQVTDEYMERYSVPVLAEIDTRALVRHLRTYGVMRGVISTQTDDVAALVQRARNIRKMDGTDLAQGGVDKGRLLVRFFRRPESVGGCPTAELHSSKTQKSASFMWWLMILGSNSTF